MKRALIEPLFDWNYAYRILQLNSKASDLQINNLKGIVKSINEYHFDATIKFGELIKSKNFKKYNKFDFNDDGTISELSISSNKNAKEIIKYKYDSGLCIEEVAYCQDGDLLSRASYKYNTEGDRIEEVINHYGGSVEKYICTYNEKNDILSKKKTSSYGGSISYNYEKNKIITKALDHKTKLDEQIEYEVNNKGDIVKVSEYIPKGAFVFKKLFKRSEINLVFNSNGDCAEENYIWYDEDDSKFFEEVNYSFGYTYDSVGNWIKIDCIFGGKYAVIEREIEYYT